MTTKRIDAISRSLTVLPSRRDVLRGLAGVGFGLAALVGSPLGESDVAAKKKRKKKKHKQSLSSPTPRITAEASRAWCRADPVVMIGDDVADIFLSAPVDAPLKVTGPSEIIVIIPNTLSGWVVLETLGFGKGENVTIVQSPTRRVTNDGIQVTIKAFVPANDDRMPVHVEFAPRVIGLLNPIREQGLANEWIVLKTDF